MKIVINGCYGAFTLSEKALAEYTRRIGGGPVEYWEIPRDNPVLVALVEEWGERAVGIMWSVTDLVIEEIDDDCEGYWTITEIDGKESIHIDKAAEKHQKAAHVLYDATLSDAEKLDKLMAMLPPLPSMLKQSKREALYGPKGPVETHLTASWPSPASSLS
jgi:hypothetical protein